MELMTAEEVAAKLKLKRSWVYTQASELGAYRLGKYWRFSWPRVLECLNKRSRSLGHPTTHFETLNLLPTKLGANKNANKNVD